MYTYAESNTVGFVEGYIGVHAWEISLLQYGKFFKASLQSIPVQESCLLG